jgi:hypothetical protein
VWTKEIDRNLLILHVLYEFYQKNDLVEIRRARLRELCDDRLNEETNGDHDSYGGGSFEGCIKELERQGFFRCIHRKKNETIIIFNIKRIEYILQREKLENSFDKVNNKMIETNVEDSILEDMKAMRDEIRDE